MTGWSWRTETVWDSPSKAVIIRTDVQYCEIILGLQGHWKEREAPGRESGPWERESALGEREAPVFSASACVEVLGVEESRGL